MVNGLCTKLGLSQKPPNCLVTQLPARSGSVSLALHSGYSNSEFSLESRSGLNFFGLVTETKLGLPWLPDRLLSTEAQSTEPTCA